MSSLIATAATASDRRADEEAERGERQIRDARQPPAAHRVPSAFSQVTGTPWRRYSHRPAALEAVTVT